MKYILILIAIIILIFTHWLTYHNGATYITVEGNNLALIDSLMMSPHGIDQCIYEGGTSTEPGVFFFYKGQRKIPNPDHRLWCSVVSPYSLNYHIKHRGER